MHDTTEEKVLEVSEEQLTRAERSEQKFTKPEPTPYFLPLLCSLALCRLGHDSGPGALFANIWDQWPALLSDGLDQQPGFWPAFVDGLSDAGSVVGWTFPAQDLGALTA